MACATLEPAARSIRGLLLARDPPRAELDPGCDRQCRYPAQDAQERPGRRPALGECPERRAGVEQLEQQGPVEIDAARSVLASEFRGVKLPDGLHHPAATPSVREARAPLDARPTRREGPVRGDPVILRGSARPRAVQRYVLATQLREAQRLRDEAVRRFRAAHPITPRRRIRRQHGAGDRRGEVDGGERDQRGRRDELPPAPRGQSARLERTARVFPHAHMAEHRAERRQAGSTEKERERAMPEEVLQQPARRRRPLRHREQSPRHARPLRGWCADRVPGRRQLHAERLPRVPLDLVSSDRKAGVGVRRERDVQPLRSCPAIVLVRRADDQIIDLDNKERTRRNQRLAVDKPAVERQSGPPQDLEVGLLRENDRVRAAHRQHAQPDVDHGLLGLADQPAGNRRQRKPAGHPVRNPQIVIEIR